MHATMQTFSPPSNVNNASTIPPSARSDKNQTELINDLQKETDRTLFANAATIKMLEKRNEELVAEHGFMDSKMENNEAINKVSRGES